MMLKGRVVSGGKEGAYFISMYASRMRERLGFEPFPGTLNIELAAPPKLPLRSLSIPAWSEAGKSFGAVWMFPAKIGRERAALVVPEKTHHPPNVIEIVSPVCLRHKPGLKDGDYVEVEVEEIEETSDFGEMRRIAREEGIEEFGFKDIVKVWKAERGGKTVAYAALRKVGEYYELDSVAVEKRHQKRGIGKGLVSILLGYCKKHGINPIYVNTREPEFFAKFGFVEIPPKKFPVELFACASCPRYKKGCNPDQMVLNTLA